MFARSKKLMPRGPKKEEIPKKEFESKTILRKVKENERRSNI